MEINRLSKDRAVDHVDFFTPEDKPYGLTYGQWTVKWWQWALSAPRAVNPLLDDTGENASLNQTGPVWFLAGTFGENKIPRRSCSIPQNKAILFPVINYEMNELENPNIKAEPDLIKHVMEDIDDITVKEATIDGQVVPIYRIASDPPIFSLNINHDNCIGVSGGTTEAAADGYWVFLKPLFQGKHHIYFHGACSGGTRNASAEYHLVVP
jgi:hypothetical protein